MNQAEERRRVADTWKCGRMGTEARAEGGGLRKEAKAGQRCHWRKDGKCQQCRTEKHKGPEMQTDTIHSDFLHALTCPFCEPLFPLSSLSLCLLSSFLSHIVSSPPLHLLNVASKCKKNLLLKWALDFITSLVNRVLYHSVLRVCVCVFFVSVWAVHVHTHRVSGKYIFHDGCGASGKKQSRNVFLISVKLMQTLVYQMCTHTFGRHTHTAHAL